MRALLLATAFVAGLLLNANAAPEDYKLKTIEGYFVAHAFDKRVSEQHVVTVMGDVCAQNPNRLRTGRNGYLVIVNRFGASGFTIEEADAVCKKLRTGAKDVGTVIPLPVLASMFSGLPEGYSPSNPMPVGDYEM